MVRSDLAQLAQSAEAISNVPCHTPRLPSFFVIENVVRLYRFHKNRVLHNRKISQVHEHGYAVDYNILRASGLGVQYGERLLVVGFKKSVADGTDPAETTVSDMICSDEVSQSDIDRRELSEPWAASRPTYRGNLPASAHLVGHAVRRSTFSLPTWKDFSAFRRASM